MKIRTQFAALIIGIILVPFSIMVGALVFSWAREPERILIPGYKEISEIAGTDIDPEQWRELAKILERRPAAIENLVLGANQTILYSGFAHYDAGRTFGYEDLFNLMRDTSHQYFYQLDRPTEKGTDEEASDFLVVSRVMRKERRPPDHITILFRGMSLVFFSILAFSLAMSSVIARSITRSVTLLDEHTRRIASGELDLALEARGSNEITSLTDSFNRMRLALKDAQVRRNRFIMGVSHDLKTPLALIKGYAEAISDGLAEEPASRAKALEIIGTKVAQLEGMIDDLIGFVKLDSGEWRQNLRLQSVSPLLRDFASRFSSDAELYHRTALADINIPDDIRVPLDDRLFVRALENLAGNALRFTEEGGTIRIDGLVSKGLVKISVSDDGIGISAEDLPRIFDLFYRGTASRREEGMGMGLAVVKTVADSHGWEIRAASEPGKGSVFTIEIPYDA